MAMTRRENEMIVRHEAGQTAEQIADEMGLRVNTVRHVVSYYTTGLVGDGGHGRMMAMGSKALLNAIRSTRSA